MPLLTKASLAKVLKLWIFVFPFYKPFNTDDHQQTQGIIKNNWKPTFAVDSLSMLKICKMNCVVDPLIINVKNTIPPVKKTNCMLNLF